MSLVNALSWTVNWQVILCFYHCNADECMPQWLIQINVFSSLAGHRTLLGMHVWQVSKEIAQLNFFHVNNTCVEILSWVYQDLGIKQHTVIKVNNHNIFSFITKPWLYELVNVSKIIAKSGPFMVIDDEVRNGNVEHILVPWWFTKLGIVKQFSTKIPQTCDYNSII